MAKRRTAARKKPARRKKPSKKLTLKSLKSEARKALEFNKKAHWKAFRELEARAGKAWQTFQREVKKKADPKIITRAKNHLMLLLGECNYMARECARMATRATKNRRR